MKKITLLSTGISLLALQLLVPSAYAVDDISARITQLEQEIAVLKRQNEINKEEAAKKAETTPVVEMSPKGLLVKSADNNFQMKLKGLVQVDSHTSIHDKNDSSVDQIQLKRVRPIIEGKLYDKYSYRIMPDFGNGQSKLFEAYGDAAIIPGVNVRVGKFKPPISVLQLQSDEDVAIMTGAMSSALVPSRDAGVALFGNILDNRLEYQAGLFNGTTDGGNSDTEVDDSKDVVLRLFATPFAHSEHLNLQKIGFGVGGSYGEKEGSITNTEVDVYKSPVQSTFFSYRSGTYADGTHKRIAPQAYYYLNSFGIIGVYTVSSQEVHLGTNRDTIENRGWDITASYVLTGEDAVYKGGVKPANNFDLKKGTWGAFEVVGRYGALTIDDDAFSLFANSNTSARKATEVETGLNWYLNESVKLMLSYNLTTFAGGATNGGDRPEEQSIFTRVQYKF